MHLDAALLAVVTRFMRERRDVEVAFQFAIDARQNVAIERCSYTCRIVVSEQQLAFRLFQIRGQKQPVARMQDLPDLAHEHRAGVAIEISNGAAEEEHEKTLTGFSARRNVEQPVQVSAFETHDADGIDPPELLPAARKSRSRNVDGIVRHRLAARKRFENPARFRSASGAKFCDGHGRRQTIHNFFRVALEQTCARARKPVLWQKRNHFEKRGAHFVIEIFRRKFFLSSFGEPRANIGGKIRARVAQDAVRVNSRCAGHWSSDYAATVRNFVYTYG